jgi:phage gpG-like protein
MPVDVDIEVKGLIETQRNMEQTTAKLHGAPMLEAMRDSTLYVQRDAKINAPVDTGILRASITPEVTSQGTEVMGIVGSNVVYAPMQELGTKPFWPPAAALEVWARRHGMDAFLAARAISRRGLKAVKFLQNAFETNREKIMRRLERGVEEAIK